jgi:hypothetical protein
MQAGGRQIRNPKSEIRNPKSEIRNPKFLFRANEKEAPLGGAGAKWK